MCFRFVFVCLLLYGMCIDDFSFRIYNFVYSENNRLQNVGCIFGSPDWTLKLECAIDVFFLKCKVIGVNQFNTSHVTEPAGLLQ